MWFGESINAKYTKGYDRRPMMQKDPFPVNEAFRGYLRRYGRDLALPVLYKDLVSYSYADPLKDGQGRWSYWKNAVYEPGQLASLNEALLKTYGVIKKAALSTIPDFKIERIDFCEYGNSMPFRIKVVHKSNSQPDFFYIKQADASRIYGLELEHLLTANPINFLYFQTTLVEEHIEGIPGDTFLEQLPNLTKEGKLAVARAFARFNENCFVRLLGDMRSYNFVVNPPVANSKSDYCIRAIDFDQQCYEGKKDLYFPLYYKENAEYVRLVLENLTPAEIERQQHLEFTAMAARIIAFRRQLMELLNSMINDDLSANYQIQLLRNELNEHFDTSRFSSCKTMGAVVKQQLKQVLQRHVKMANER